MCQNGGVVYREFELLLLVRDLVVGGLKLLATCRGLQCRLDSVLEKNKSLLLQFRFEDTVCRPERLVKRHETLVLLNVKTPYCDQIKRRLGQFLLLTTTD